jgi:L-threonylcarbamoyladenylate synthase
LDVERATADAAIAAPGMMASHYAPAKPLQLDVEHPDPDQFHIGFGAIFGQYNLSIAGDLAQAAAHVFAALHCADASEYPRIAVAPIPETGIGIAIMDRLRRAAQS